MLYPQQHRASRLNKCLMCKISGNPDLWMGNNCKKNTDVGKCFAKLQLWNSFIN